MTAAATRTAEVSPMLVRPVFSKFFDLQALDASTLCSPPRHFGGFFKGSRLFGGHTAAQAFVAAKRLNGRQPYGIVIHFYAPGVLDHDLLYRQTSPLSVASGFVHMDVVQKNVLLSTVSCRLQEPSSSDLDPLLDSSAFLYDPAFARNALRIPGLTSSILFLTQRYESEREYQ
ncbi:hypothetical protein M3Y99_00026900 [Aphelenchoides fujianensis]|nr:hypothetical protein M3Y99_00026900 [Aphelenchoides fujianensis]